MQVLQTVAEITEAALARGDAPLIWGIDLSTALQHLGAPIPSIELGQWLLTNAFKPPPTVPSSAVWLYLKYSMATYLVFPMHVLALLTSKVIPVRTQQPYMYNAFLELASTYTFSVASSNILYSSERIIEAVDEVLSISKSIGVSVKEVGAICVHFLFLLVYKLAHATVEDLGSSICPSEMQKEENGNSTHVSHGQDSAVVVIEDDKEPTREKPTKERNTIRAVELLAKIMLNKKSASLLRLARGNRPEGWSLFAQCLQSLEDFLHDTSLKVPKAADAFGHLAKALQQGLYHEWQPNQVPVVKVLLDTGTCTWGSSNAWGNGPAAAWLPFDIFMENAMENRRVPATSTAQALTDLMKSLQAIQSATWHDLFLGLWTAALRLVDREREHIEGPRHHVESRLAMLLSIVPLASAAAIEEEESFLQHSTETLESSGKNGNSKEKKFTGVRRKAFLSSLQVISQFDGLLCPPQFAVTAANQAAATATAFIATSENGIFEGPSLNAGDIRHLIVEVCIARGLLDASEYWCRSLLGVPSAISQSPVSQSSPWLTFMEGAPLSGPLKTALLSTAAGSLAELEKVYLTAINGPEEERAAAASILCGASLIRGWHVQEHSVRLAVKLLSPPSVSADGHGGSTHLIDFAPMLLAALGALTSDDAVNVLSLHGMIPDLAASLLPICEIFGSLSPSIPLTSNSGEEASVHMLFSLAFLLLLRLWKFHRPPVESRLLGGQSPFCADLSLDYLLQLRNTHMRSSVKSSNGSSKNSAETPTKTGGDFLKSSSSLKNFVQASTKSQQPVYLDFFPKLRGWYTQNEACIASTLAGVVHGSPVHQTADKLLNTMFKKLSRTGTASVQAGVSNTSLNSIASSAGEDAAGRPLLPAWDIIEAIPFVLDAVLTACAYGKLSSRDLTTGLRDLVDYFPASIATIVSYFTAEITRGLWKAASMNGNDWPSPASNLLSVEGEIKDILANSGVFVPSFHTGGGNAPATLPLPLAALVSLTITFKVDKVSEMCLAVAGPALGSAAAGCPWPSMPIIAALWAQKVKRWHDFIVFSSTRALFKQDKNAVRQLVRRCFSVTLGSSSSSISKLIGKGGVGPLLGHGNWSYSTPGCPLPVAPGILYLRMHPELHDIMFLTDEILLQVTAAAKNCAVNQIPAVNGNSLPHFRSRSSQTSFSTCMEQVLQASSLGASLLVISGGSTLIQSLYQESLPAWFLSSGAYKSTKDAQSKPVHGTVLEGHVVAHFSLLAATLAWGVPSLKSQQSPVLSEVNGASLNSQRCHILGSHMEFLASALDGKIILGCEHTTWKAYVIAFLALLVSCIPGWISDVRTDILKRLAKGLRFWHEHELAVLLLEQGGSAAMGTAAEILLR
ncbi:hypothetical protein O6H91_23G002600 [Diphasiastrum complanatum]|uniref:Uncharacterized protein n=1 Tax=Diphasiastrum complanatum TaxID=34168 RepID=A0ACC2A7M2_DIPCM|nr:hypothetical protein O6H91_23G002600 [Diphasiastrum complanatum]